MGVTATVAVGIAAGLDALVGELPTALHPVAWFGRAVDSADREYSDQRVAGVVLACVLPLVAAVLVGGAVALALRLDVWVGAALAGLALFVTTSLRRLLEAAWTVVTLAGSDIERAREAAPALVGRDPSALSPGELRSAAVESAAENLADGLVAPLTAFALGVQVGLAVGAAAAAWVKAVNTLDSMLGYRDRPLGWASARLDDAVMWAPARLSAVLIAVAAGRPGALLRGSRWAARPPSPNSGWPMATLAAALDVRLEKPEVYTLVPDRSLPTASDGRRGIRIVAVAGVLAVVLAGGAVFALGDGRGIALQGVGPWF